MSIAGVFLTGVVTWLVAWCTALGMAALARRSAPRRALSLFDDEQVDSCSRPGGTP